MPSFLRRFLLWTLVCSLSAAPSFIIAVGLHPQAHQVWAMLLGVFMFIMAYTVVTGLPFFLRMKENRRTRRTLYIGYGTRLFISVVFPVGMYIDILAGIVSTATTEALFSNGESFAAILATTLMQGLVLNVLLLSFMGLVHLGQRIVLGKAAPVGHCPACQYDLRASRDNCPECGTPIYRMAA